MSVQPCMMIHLYGCENNNNEKMHNHKRMQRPNVDEPIHSNGKSTSMKCNHVNCIRCTFKYIHLTFFVHAMHKISFTLVLISKKKKKKKLLHFNESKIFKRV